MEQNLITRSFPGSPEIRDKRTITGLAIPFGKPLQVQGRLREQWHPGSVKFHERGCFLFWFHDPSQPLASTASGRLRLEERSDGLYYDADIPETTLGNDLLAMIALNEVRGVSPGFKPLVTPDWEYGREYDTRHYRSTMVGEISLTHIPAYLETTIEQRNTGDIDEELKRIEERKTYLAGLRQRTIHLLSTRGN